MAAKTVKQLRAYLKAEMQTLFGATYTVYDSRIRMVDASKIPICVIGVTSAQEGDDQVEEVTIRVQVTHKASGTDYDAADCDAVLMDRVEDDVYKIRNRFMQSDIEPVCGHVTRTSWTYDAADDGNVLTAWANVDVTFRRAVFWTDDAPEVVDFDTAYIETTIDDADTTIETEVTI